MKMSFLLLLLPSEKKDFILSMNFFQKNHQSRSPCKFLIFHAENPCTSYVTFALCWWCCTTVQKQHELRITWMGQLMCCAMMMNNFIGIGMMMAKQKKSCFEPHFWGIKNAIKEVSDGHFRLSNGRDFLSSPFYHPFILFSINLQSKQLSLNMMATWVIVHTMWCLTAKFKP